MLESLFLKRLKDSSSIFKLALGKYYKKKKDKFLERNYLGNKFFISLSNKYNLEKYFFISCLKV